MMHLIFHQPEIPQNVGTMVRLCACLGVPLGLIEPLGFFWSNPHFRRAGMDYRLYADVHRHTSWAQFMEKKRPGRVIALVPKSPTSYVEFTFLPQDYLVVGSESCGLSDLVCNQVDHQVAIPMRPGMRSLNVAVAAALVLGEALRQNQLFPLLTG